MESGVNCRDCMAACCRAGNRYSLRSSEAAAMSLTNENIVHSAYGDLMNDRLPVYELEEDCPNLVQETEEDGLPEFQCALYDDPTRPGCCTFIQPGGEYCLSARKKFGYDDAQREPIEEFVCKVPSSQ